MLMLHTSDWHLGAMLDSAPRDEEQSLFLQWLTARLAELRVDLLVIAGDLFHQAQPSAEAQQLYYRFLARLAREAPDCRVVVVGGNHDSASRLDAPREVLAALSVHVVGGLDEDRSRCLYPVRGRSGEVEAVVVAVPFVHEFRLGVRTAGRTPTEIAQEFKEAFAGLYRALADQASARWAGVPLVATGHLTCGTRPPPDETGTEVHQVGTIGALPAEIFDPRFDYVALGHLHRPMRVAHGRAWYSGSPVPVGLVEASVARRVLLVELPERAGAEPRVQSLPVPAFRELVRVQCSLAEVGTRLAALRPSASGLVPYVEVTLDEAVYAPENRHKVREAADALPAPRPRILDVLQPRRQGATPETPDAPPPSLSELTPEQVFLRLYQARNGEDQQPADALLIAFREAHAEALAAERTRRAREPRRPAGPAPTSEAQPLAQPRSEVQP